MRLRRCGANGHGAQGQVPRDALLPGPTTSLGSGLPQGDAHLAGPGASRASRSTCWRPSLINGYRSQCSGQLWLLGWLVGPAASPKKEGGGAWRVCVPPSTHCKVWTSFEGALVQTGKRRARVQGRSQDLPGIFSSPGPQSWRDVPLSWKAPLGQKHRDLTAPCAQGGREGRELSPRRGRLRGSLHTQQKATSCLGSKAAHPGSGGRPAFGIQPVCHPHQQQQTTEVFAKQKKQGPSFQEPPGCHPLAPAPLINIQQLRQSLTEVQPGTCHWRPGRACANQTEMAAGLAESSAQSEQP